MQKGSQAFLSLPATNQHLSADDQDFHHGGCIMPRISCLARLQPICIKRLARNGKTGLPYKLPASSPYRFTNGRLPKLQFQGHLFSRQFVRPMLEILEDRTPAGAIASA